MKRINMVKVVKTSLIALTMSSTVFLAVNNTVQTQASKSINSISEQILTKANASEINKVPNRSIGVDVASYQSTDLTQFKNAGAKFVIAKATQGNWYTNEKFAGQAASAKSLGMMVNSYHYSEFGADSNKASQEANFALKTIGSTIQKGNYFAVDYEAGATSDIDANTNAVMTFMRATKNAGYQPLLYTGAYYTKNLNIEKILAEFPNSLWIASYKTTDSQTTPDFDYFPSMKGVLIWQFTDKLNGMNVDGNVNVLEMVTKTDETSNSGSTGSNSNSNSNSNNSSSSSSSNSNSSSNSSSSSTTESSNVENKPSSNVQSNPNVDAVNNSDSTLKTVNETKNSNMDNTPNTEKAVATSTSAKTNVASTPAKVDTSKSQQSLVQTAESKDKNNIIGSIVLAITTITSAILGFISFKTKKSQAK